MDLRGREITPEVVEEMGKDWIKNAIPLMDPKEILQKYDVSEVIKYYEPSEVISKYHARDILENISKEQLEELRKLLDNKETFINPLLYDKVY